MIYHDDGRYRGVAEKSLAFFQATLYLIGEIKAIKMTDYVRSETVYPFKVIGEMGEIWLSGCTAGYLGEGPEATVQIMQELGYPVDACGVVFRNREFQMGPPNRWKPKPVPKKSIPDLAMEVLEFIEEFYAENGFMPTGGEIKDGCENITNVSAAHERLHSLKEMGYIEIRYRKPRGIVLL